MTVTCEDAEHASILANVISEVLRERIEDIIDGSSMRIVDSAVPNSSKVSPNVSGNVLVAFLVGCAVVALAVILYVIFDDTIRTEEHITGNYDIPILARVPDLDSAPASSRYGYYRYYYKKHTGDES